jgi:hypothetical protein
VYEFLQGWGLINSSQGKNGMDMTLLMGPGVAARMAPGTSALYSFKVGALCCITKQWHGDLRLLWPEYVLMLYSFKVGARRRLQKAASEVQSPKGVCFWMAKGQGRVNV